GSPSCRRPVGANRPLNTSAATIPIRAAAAALPGLCCCCGIDKRQSGRGAPKCQRQHDGLFHCPPTPLVATTTQNEVKNIAFNPIATKVVVPQWEQLRIAVRGERRGTVTLLSPLPGGPRGL